MLLRLHAVDGRLDPIETDAAAGEKLYSAIWLSGRIKARPVCGGLGACGLCAVRFLSAPPEPTAEEENYFPPEKLAAGWRLACRHTVPAGSGEINLAVPNLQPQVHRTIPAIDARIPVCLGVDLGTTSIEWRALRDNGEIVGSGKFFNPQAGAGGDVISRLAAASTPAGMARLADLVWNSLADLTAELACGNMRTNRACIAANSALAHILLRLDTSGLAHAPYRLAWHGGEIRDIILHNKKIPCVFPPLISPFTGGDISAGLLWLTQKNTPRPFILADLGTNAELALLTDRLYLASVPLGPAMEGIGPRCGRVAGPDTATAFMLTPGGIRPNRERVEGISATGYLSLLAILLNAGIMDSAGHFRQASEVSMPLAKALAENISTVRDRQRLNICQNLYLSADDVEMLLKVKGAFAVALDSLLKAAKLAPSDIAAFILGGALGEHASVPDLETLGFIPRALAAKTRSCGNTSLNGACLLATHPDLLSHIAGLCANAEILALTEDPLFSDNYMRAMHWGPDV